MRRKKLLVGVAVLAAMAVGLYVFARHALGSDYVRATLEQQLSAHLGQPVRIAAASVAVFPRVSLDLHDVEIGSPAAVQFGRIRIVTGLRPLLSRTVSDAEVIVSGGQIVLPLPFTLAAVNPPGADPAATPALTVTSVRSIELRGISLVGGNQAWVIDAECGVQGDRLEIRRLSARAPVTHLQATGALASISRLEGELTATADPLNLDELLAFGSKASATPGTSTGSEGADALPMRLAVDLTAPVGQLAGYQFRDLSARIDVVPGRLALSPLSVKTFGGSFQGRLDADTRRAVPSLRLNGRIEGIDVAALMKAAGSTGGMTGRLGADISLAGAGTDSQVLMRTARGSMSAAITDGTMERLDMVRTIVLAFGTSDGAPPQGSGSAFSRLAGAFTMSNSTVASDRVTLSSRDFDMSGRGTVQLLTGNLSARGDVILSEALTAQSGRDLRRYAQQDGRVIVPATIGGTLQQPKVSLDIAAATRRALGNELERRATSWLDGLLKKKEE